MPRPTRGRPVASCDRSAMQTCISAYPSRCALSGSRRVWYQSLAGHGWRVRLCRLTRRFVGRASRGPCNEPGRRAIRRRGDARSIPDRDRSRRLARLHAPRVGTRDLRQPAARPRLPPTRPARAQHVRLRCAPRTCALSGRKHRPFGRAGGCCRPTRPGTGGSGVGVGRRAVNARAGRPGPHAHLGDREPERRRETLRAALRGRHRRRVGRAWPGVSGPLSG